MDDIKVWGSRRDRVSLRVQYSNRAIHGNSSMSVRSPPKILWDRSLPQSAGSRGLLDRSYCMFALLVSGVVAVFPWFCEVSVPSVRESVSGFWLSAGQHTLGLLPTKPHCDCLKKFIAAGIKGCDWSIFNNGGHSLIFLHVPGKLSGVRQADPVFSVKEIVAWSNRNGINRRTIILPDDLGATALYILLVILAAIV